LVAARAALSIGVDDGAYLDRTSHSRGDTREARWIAASKSSASDQVLAAERFAHVSERVVARDTRDRDLSSGDANGPRGLD
jgi:hypothetical protein